MGVFVDYVLHAECTEEEMRERLQRVSRRCRDLPVTIPVDVKRVEPLYSPHILMLYRCLGHKLPPAVAQRIRKCDEDADHRDLCLTFHTIVGPQLPHDLLMAYLDPPLTFIKQTDLWKSEEMPAVVKQPMPMGLSGGLSLNRECIEFEFANVMLRYGYALIIDPGEGSESIYLTPSTFKPLDGSEPSGPSLWAGMSFTRTQYAKEFVQVHETVCRVLDIVQEEGLLHKASDTCGYYATRSWSEAGKQVNEEQSLAKMVGDLMGMLTGNLREEGVDVQVVQDNASNAKLVDFAAALARELAKPTESAPSKRRPPGAARDRGEGAPRRRGRREP